MTTKHTVFGHVVKGQDVVDKIAQNDKINKVTIIRIGEKAANFKNDQEAFEDMVKNQEKLKAAKFQDKIANDLKTIEKNWPEAKKTKSGLMYIVRAEGSGSDSPVMGSRVKNTL